MIAVVRKRGLSSCVVMVLVALAGDAEALAPRHEVEAPPTVGERERPVPTYYAVPVVLFAAVVAAIWFYTRRPGR